MSAPRYRFWVMTLSLTADLACAAGLHISSRSVATTVKTRTRSRADSRRPRIRIRHPSASSEETLDYGRLAVPLPPTRAGRALVQERDRLVALEAVAVGQLVTSDHAGRLVGVGRL